jgi:hypothetical protein
MTDFITEPIDAEQATVQLLGALLTLCFFVLIIVAAFAIFEIKRTLHKIQSMANQAVGIMVKPTPSGADSKALANYLQDWREADVADRHIIKETVRHEFGKLRLDVDFCNVPDELISFWISMTK